MDHRGIGERRDAVLQTAMPGGDAFMSDLTVRPDPKAIPAEIKRWNWGAFLLNWIWGIGNQTYIALLALIPGFGFIWMLVLGAKGNAWAWRNGRWDSVEHFKRVQRRWAIWGLVIWLAVAVLFGGMIGGIFFGLKHSAAYEMGVAKLQGSAIAVSILGSPISTGMPFGGISFNGSSGMAELSFSATGLFLWKRSRKTVSGRSGGSRSNSTTAARRSISSTA